MRRRLLIWLGWPALVVFAGVVLPFFAWLWFDMRYAVFEMGWGRAEALQFLAVVLLPPVIFEVIARIRRNNG